MAGPGTRAYVSPGLRRFPPALPRGIDRSPNNTALEGRKGTRTHDTTNTRNANKPARQGLGRRGEYRRRGRRGAGGGIGAPSAARRKTARGCAGVTPGGAAPPRAAPGARAPLACGQSFTYKVSAPWVWRPVSLGSEKELRRRCTPAPKFQVPARGIVMPEAGPRHSPQHPPGGVGQQRAARPWAVACVARRRARAPGGGLRGAALGRCWALMEWCSKPCAVRQAAD